MTPEQLLKLPKWAQDEFKSITMERDNASRVLNEFVDNSTPSPFYVEEMVCVKQEGKAGPHRKRSYIQAYAINVEYEGVLLRVSANNYNGIKGIDIQWSDPTRNMREIAFVPNSYQKASLICKENMR